MVIIIEHLYIIILGTYSPDVQLHAESDCFNCTGGSYCPTHNMTAIGPDCQQGNIQLLVVNVPWYNLSWYISLCYIPNQIYPQLS